MWWRGDIGSSADHAHCRWRGRQHHIWGWRWSVDEEGHSVVVGTGYGNRRQASQCCCCCSCCPLCIVSLFLLLSKFEAPQSLEGDPAREERKRRKTWVSFFKRHEEMKIGKRQVSQIAVSLLVFACVCVHLHALSGKVPTLVATHSLTSKWTVEWTMQSRGCSSKTARVEPDSETD